MKKLRNKKGFTLVEIIVVLVILAILAAAAIPTMLGFVNDAKGKAEIANARAAYLACQMIATEDEATGRTDALGAGPYTIAAPNGGTGVQRRLNDMLGADLVGAMVTVVVADGKVTKLTYTSVDTKTQVVIEPGKAADVTRV